MMSVIILEDVPVVYSPMSLVEPVRGDVSSTQQQQNTAAPHATIIGRLAQGIELSCALVIKKPDLALDQTTETKRMSRPSRSQQNFNFGKRSFPNYNRKLNSDKIQKQ